MFRNDGILTTNNILRHAMINGTAEYQQCRMPINESLLLYFRACFHICRSLIKSCRNTDMDHELADSHVLHALWSCDLDLDLDPFGHLRTLIMWRRFVEIGYWILWQNVSKQTHGQTSSVWVIYFVNFAFFNFCKSLSQITSTLTDTNKCRCIYFVFFTYELCASLFTKP